MFPNNVYYNVCENESLDPNDPDLKLVKTVLCPEFPKDDDGNYIINHHTNWPILDLRVGSVLYNVSVLCRVF